MTDTSLTLEQDRRAEALERAARAAFRQPSINAAAVLPDEAWAHLTALAEWIVGGLAALDSAPAGAPALVDGEQGEAPALAVACKACGQDHEIADIADDILARSERHLRATVRNLRYVGIDDVAEHVDALIGSDRLRGAVATVTLREAQAISDATARVLRKLSLDGE